MKHTNAEPIIINRSDWQIAITMQTDVFVLNKANDVLGNSYRQTYAHES